MKRRTRFVVAVIVLSLASLLQMGALAATQVINGSLTSESLTMSTNLLPNGAQNTCDAPKGFPGTSGGTVRYDTHTVTNDDSESVCVVVSLTAPSNAFMQVSAYLTTFDPLNLATNYLGDNGSGVLDGTTWMSFWLDSGATAVIVVNDYVNTFGAAPYTLEIFIPEDMQACLYAGSLSRVKALDDGGLSCGRGERIELAGGTDYFGCLYAGSLSQIGTNMPDDCGRGEMIGLASGKDPAACLYAGRLSQVGYGQPSSCGRGEIITLQEISFSCRVNLPFAVTGESWQRALVNAQAC